MSLSRIASFIAAGSAVVVVTGAVLLGGTGCPPAEGEGEGEATPDQVNAALGDFLDRCGTAAFGSTATFEPTLVGILLGQLKAEVAALGTNELSGPNVTFDSAKAATCIAQLKAATCGDLSTLDGIAPACNEVTSGKLALGTACAVNTECAGTGVSCFGANDTTCGTCTAFAASGADCTAADCAKGFDCDATTHKCTATPAPLHEGDACNGDCNNSDLVCDNGTCATVAVAQIGDDCDFTTHHCIDSATKNVCDFSTSKCEARPALGDDCAALGVCDQTTASCDTASHTCIAAVGDGGACTSSSECSAGLTCDTTCGPEITPPTVPTCN